MHSWPWILTSSQETTVQHNSSGLLHAEVLTLTISSFIFEQLIFNCNNYAYHPTVPPNLQKLYQASLSFKDSREISKTSLYHTIASIEFFKISWRKALTLKHCVAKEIKSSMLITSRCYDWKASKLSPLLLFITH